MNNYDIFKASLSAEDRKIIDSDDFTFYAMDILVFSDSEIDIEKLKTYFFTYKKLLHRNKLNSFIAYRVLFPINDILSFFHIPFYFSYDSGNKNIFFNIVKENKKLNCYNILYKRELLKIPALKIKA